MANPFIATFDHGAHGDSMLFNGAMTKKPGCFGVTGSYTSPIHGGAQILTY